MIKHENICLKHLSRLVTKQSDCAPSEDSDQPGYRPSLIRDFAVRMKKARTVSYSLRTQRGLLSDWADATLLVLSRGGSFYYYNYQTERETKSLASIHQRKRCVSPPCMVFIVSILSFLGAYGVASSGPHL